MTSFAGWSYTTPLTVWPVEYDQYSQPVSGAPYLITGTWIEGGEVQSDAQGVEFLPRASYFFEMAEGPLLPQVRFRIKRGDHTAEGEYPDDAEAIRKVSGWDVSMFPDVGLPDWAVYT